MGKLKLDSLFLCTLDYCVKWRHRLMLLVLGEKALKQVAVLHHVLLKIRVKNGMSDPSILWCFKKGCSFSLKASKLKKKLKRNYSANYSLSDEDVWDHFIASANINFCHFSDIASALGQTYGMLVIQDFEALTPNILAHLSECIEGGGLICIIVSSILSLQEIPYIKMDAHSKYKTISHPKVKPNFNLRFTLSLSTCKNIFVLDENLRVILSPKNLNFNSSPQSVVNPVSDVPTPRYEIDTCTLLDKVFTLCCTSDQSKSLNLLAKALLQKSKQSIAFLTSARGRGKSATLGLSVSIALHQKISTIYVTSPQVENVQTLFSFVIKGLNSLEYKESKDYCIVYKKESNYKLITELRIFHDHRQIVKYFEPAEYHKVGSADLVVIDEAAAIPLPVVKKWMTSNFVFIASTVCGYEGTGRSLSLKLVNQLREKCCRNNNQNLSHDKDFVLYEIILNQAIRYSDGDEIEKWMYSVFCLNAETSFLSGSCPDPESCQLYYINKSVLFSYNKAAESFLQQVVSLFVTSHYKNCPNDLLMMADAPSHHLFCLLSPHDKNLDTVPYVLCILQIALEGKFPKDYIIQEMSDGKRASGDLIPWIISQQFQDKDFPSLCGARIVRIATHPNYQRMGYGKRTLQLFFSHCQTHSGSSSSHGHIESIPMEKPVLLLKLDELSFPKLDYVGVSYGLTIELLRFWKRLDLVPLYIRQTPSEVTGEHSCLMIHTLNNKNKEWQVLYLHDFLKRFLILLSSAFKDLPSAIVLEILHFKKVKLRENDEHTNKTLLCKISVCDFKRLSSYCSHLVDYHLILDLLPSLSQAYFLHQFQEFFLSHVQEAVLASVGLQHKSIEIIAEELTMESTQIMGVFVKIIKKFLPYLHRCNNTDEISNIKVKKKA